MSASFENEDGRSHTELPLVILCLHRNVRVNKLIYRFFRMETFLPFLPLKTHIQMARLTPQPHDLIKKM